MRKILSILMAGLLVGLGGLLVSCGSKGDKVNLDKVSQDYLPVVDSLNALVGRIVAVKNSGLKSKWEELKSYIDLVNDSYDKASSYLAEAFNEGEASYGLRQTKIRILINRHEAEVNNLLYCMKKMEKILN